MAATVMMAMAKMAATVMATIGDDPDNGNGSNSKDGNGNDGNDRGRQ